MFLYLSKLLPLFFYPLGLACVCMLIAFIMLWKRPRTAAFFIVLSLVVLLVSSNSWVARSLVRSLEWQNIPGGIPNAEAIVVLGGATKSAFPPRPTVDLNEAGDRVLYAAQLYLQKKHPRSSSVVVGLIGGVGVHLSREIWRQSYLPLVYQQRHSCKSLIP